MTLQFRRCVAEDLDALRAISVKTYYETFAAVNTPENMEAYLQAAYNEQKLCRELMDGNQEFYFLYAGDTLAGYLKINEAPAQVEFHDPKALEIERLYVSKEFLGIGLGQYLMDKAVAMAQERSKEYIWLVSGNITSGRSGSTSATAFTKLVPTPSSWATMTRPIT